MRRCVALIAMIPVALSAGAIAQEPPKATLSNTAKIVVTAERPNCAGAETLSKIRACGIHWVKLCKQDWDAGTHMTKQEYARVCQRVAEERVKYLVSQLPSTPAAEK